jgi:hypothetical protein
VLVGKWHRLCVYDGGLRKLMPKSSHAESAPDIGAKPPRVSDRRRALRRTVDLELRVEQKGEHLRANPRELDLQFQRIAQIQADLDMLTKLVRGTPPRCGPGPDER